MAEKREQQKRRGQIREDNQPESTEGHEFFVVGIGASAGGLEALEAFFTNMEPKSGLAFVVIQHLSPDYKSLMAEILSKHTSMPVHEASDGLNVQPNNIYLIPPKKNMTIFHYHLQLTDKGVDQGLNLPIDIFLHSLAEDLGEKAIAIIMSGTGSDGTRGIRAIKEQGGMVMAQDEYSAKFDGMPRSAIATQLVDYVLPPNQMARELVNYVQHPCLALGPMVKTTISTDDETLSKIFAAIRSRSGVDFSFYKQSTMIRRIERRMSINQIENLEQYLHFLYRSPAEIDSLYKELLIGVTRFFRDEEAFNFLRVKVIPQFFEGKRSQDQIRVWVAGCSTGEEAYSLAILLREQLEAGDHYLDIKVFATDVDQEALEFASKGVYPESIAADVSRDRLKKYFVKKGDNYEVQRFIREMVIFARQNLLKDPPFSKIDLISCRNVLIYLESSLQKKVISMFQFALKPEGFLFLGTSETVGAEHDVFQIQHTKWKIYRNIGRFRPPLEPPVADALDYPPERRRPPLSFKYNDRNRVSSRTQINETIYHSLIEAFLSACVVVNQEAELLHVFGEVDQYLQVPSGGPFTSNILKMVRPDLSIALSTAIHRVLRDQTEVVYKNMSVRNRQGMAIIDMIAKPFLNANQQYKLVFIQFKPVNESDNGHIESGEPYNIDQKVNQRIADLEQELKYTKENLQATIEELETSNEELQATNEELMAANEELQSTNEELQSVNEELITVNAEFQAKIMELTELNNDMSNLLRNTEIGTIFLDNELCVRKFTPAVQDDVKLMDQDIGRPLNHIAHNLKNFDLASEAERVLHTLQNQEVEVDSTTGRWYLVRIRPYNTAENVIKGVVITLVNITRLKTVEADLKDSEARYQSMVQDQVELLFRYQADGTLTFVNQIFCSYFDKKEQEVIGENFLSFMPAEDRKRMLKDLQDLSPNDPVSTVERRVQRRNGDFGWLRCKTRAILNEKGQIAEYQTTALDLTERRDLEAQLREHRDNDSE